MDKPNQTQIIKYLLENYSGKDNIQVGLELKGGEENKLYWQHNQKESSRLEQTLPSDLEIKLNTNYHINLVLNPTTDTASLSIYQDEPERPEDPTLIYDMGLVKISEMNLNVPGVDILNQVFSYISKESLILQQHMQIIGLKPQPKSYEQNN